MAKHPVHRIIEQEITAAILDAQVELTALEDLTADWHEGASRAICANRVIVQMQAVLDALKRQTYREQKVDSPA